MPLCPQITNTPITVTQNSDFDVASTIPLIANTYDGLANNIEEINAEAAAALAAAASATTTANSAAAAAGAAQSTANTALANAATAYTAATGSLQPSANTIVNASNQITAINGTGITVYSGASATTGPRVVLNSLGLAAYGSGSSVNITGVSGNGTNVTYTASGHSFPVGRSITVSGLAPEGYNGTFVIISVVAGSTFTVANTTTATVTDSNGVAESATLAISATTGNAVFSGSITGSTIIGGTLNIGGNAIIDSSGLLTATGATITGTINATAGYFGTSTNGFSISSTGLVGVGTGTIVGGTIQGATFNNGSGTFFVSSAGVVTAISGTIGGWSLSSTSISKTVSTRTTTLNASDGLISIYDSNTGFLAGGAISVGTPSITTSFSSAGFSFGSDAVIDVRNELGSYSGTLRIYAPSNKGIRLVPNAGTTSGTYLVTVEGSLSVFGNILSPTISGSITSTGSLSTGSGNFVVNSSGAITAVTTITASGLITAQNGVTVSGAPVYTGTPTATPTNSTEGTALTNGGTVIGRRSNDTPLMLHIFNVTATTGTSVPIVQFYRNATARGTLEVYGNTVAPVLVGSSDYRLKENIRDYDDALNKVLSARVRVFNEIEDETKNDIVGFVAHEFAEVFPNFVSGEKDAVDENGQPVYQKLGYGNMIPYLVGAIQELHKEITLLKGE